MFCPNCGQENRDTARFCITCGARLGKGAPAPVMTPPPPEPASTAPGEAAPSAPEPTPLMIDGSFVEPTPAPAEPEQIAAMQAPASPEAEFPVPFEEPVADASVVAAEAVAAPAAEPAQETPVDVQPSVEAAEAAPAEVIPVEAGTVVQNRYKIVEARSAENGALVYEAEDLRCCYVCQGFQTDEEAHYCELCGAELIRWPRVVLAPVTSPVDPSEIIFIGDNSYIVRDETAPADHSEPAQAEGEADEAALEEQPAQAAQHASAKRLGLSCGFLTDTGVQREINEDSLLAIQLTALCENQPAPKVGFYVVADGIGGHEAGEIASRAAVQALGTSAMQSLLGPLLNAEDFSTAELHERLKTVVYNANLRVLGMRHQAGVDNNMGCTLTAALVYDTHAVIANVGDSRTYLMKDGHLCPVTQDHSVVARMVERGELTREEIYNHPQKNVIYRSLGDKPDLELDLYDLELAEGDRLLLCSDGLWEMVRDPMIEETLLAIHDHPAACRQLVQLANQAGGEDNISVVIAGLNLL